MQTNIDTRTYSSYTQTQSSSSDSNCDAFRGNAVASEQVTETSYAPQVSRSPNGSSMSRSMATFEQTSGKGGADQSFGFSGTQSQHGAQNAACRRDDRSDRRGNQKNDSRNNQFRNNDNNRCGVQKSNWNNAQTKNEQSHCSSQKTQYGNTQIENDKNQCGGQQGSWSNAQTNNDQSHCSSQKTPCGNTQIENDKNQCGGQQGSWNTSTTQVKTGQSYSGSQKTANSQARADKSKSGSQQNDWTNTQVANNNASIDLGDYDIGLSKSNSSISLTNEKTGDTTQIWGDPHITTDGTTGMFNGSMTFDLPGNTKVTVGTQAQGSVSYADQVTITQGNNAYVVNGLSQNDSNPLTVERSNNGRQLDQQTADGFTLVANRSGTGWIDPQTGVAPTAADFSKA